MSVRLLALLLLAAAASVAPLDAQGLFRSEEPLNITLTTNLRDLVRERDSTRLRWFGAEMAWVDATGETRTMPVELRARGHFRRQAANCAFPPIFIRAKRQERTGTILQGNPRVKVVTPCRPASADYQQYIFTEYQIYRTYQVIDSMHHRTRLASITYQDSAGRARPVTVTAFLLETASEVADQYAMELFESTGVTWDFIAPSVIDRISLFQYWVGNTDWSVSGLHNIIMLDAKDGQYRPIPYDFDWTGTVNARYAKPNSILPIRSVRQRLHRGPCRSAEEWAPTIALFRAQRATADSIWSIPLPGQDPGALADAKKYLDDFWAVLDDPRRFKREILDTCQREGN